MYREIKVNDLNCTYSLDFNYNYVLSMKNKEDFKKIDNFLHKKIANYEYIFFNGVKTLSIRLFNNIQDVLK